MRVTNAQKSKTQVVVANLLLKRGNAYDTSLTRANEINHYSYTKEIVGKYITPIDSHMEYKYYTLEGG
uniref:Lipoprotein n=1 Tax=Heterorhabditis bacteriophora TaxID=37862 RepID=A0A1I7WUC4_HETBA